MDPQSPLVLIVVVPGLWLEFLLIPVCMGELELAERYVQGTFNFFRALGSLALSLLQKRHQQPIARPGE